MATTSLNPGVGPTNADIATAVAAPSSATIASAVAAAVPTTAGITTIVQSNAGGKTRKILTLTSGTSYTVPAGVTFLNVTLTGGGGGGGAIGNPGVNAGTGGTTTFTGATSAPGGTGGNRAPYNDNTSGLAAAANTGQGGGSGSYASSQVGISTGWFGRDAAVIRSTLAVTAGASISYSIGAGGAGATGFWTGGAGGSGKIDVEYWS